MKRLLVVLASALILLFLTATAATAHPLGNFTVNSFSALRVGPSRVLIDHVTDRAEIPTQQLTFAGDPISRSSAAADQRAWSRRDCGRVLADLQLSVDGRGVALTVESTEVHFPPGAGGLPTSRLTCRLSSAALTLHDKSAIDYQDHSDDGRVGWHEIIAVGDGASLNSSDVPDSSVSRALTAYPKDLLSSPPTVKQAHVVASPGGASASDPLAGTDSSADKEQRRGNDGPTAAFTDLVGRHRLGLGIGFLAVFLALLLGAFHAFAPGHGKTVMAAYLVADRGSLRQVILIGLAVTATHTLGVLILGVLVSTYATFAPETAYPWLRLVSGLLLLSIGVSLALAAWRRRVLWSGKELAVDDGHVHEVTSSARVPEDNRDRHHHGQDHDHHGQDHDHHGQGHHDHDIHEHDQGHHDHDCPHDHDHDSHDHDRDHDHPVPHPHGDESETYRQQIGALAGEPSPSSLGGATSPAAVLERPAEPLVHSHGGRTHSHAPVTGEPIRLRSLLSMGLAGGLVPSPSALVVLLGAINLHRAWFGVILVVCYGAGMAGTLVGVGLLLSRLRGRFMRRLVPGSRFTRGFALLPLGTASLICAIGTYLAISGLLKV